MSEPQFLSPPQETTIIATTSDETQFEDRQLDNFSPKNLKNWPIFAQNSISRSNSAQFHHPGLWKLSAKMRSSTKLRFSPRQTYIKIPQKMAIFCKCRVPPGVTRKRGTYFGTFGGQTCAILPRGLSYLAQKPPPKPEKCAKIRKIDFFDDFGPIFDNFWSNFDNFWRFFWPPISIPNLTTFWPKSDPNFCRFCATLKSDLPDWTPFHWVKGAAFFDHLLKLGWHDTLALISKNSVWGAEGPVFPASFDQFFRQFSRIDPVHHPDWFSYAI